MRPSFEDHLGVQIVDFLWLLVSSAILLLLVIILSFIVDVVI